jgi:hypothetical protein
VALCASGAGPLGHAELGSAPPRCSRSDGLIRSDREASGTVEAAMGSLIKKRRKRMRKKKHKKLLKKTRWQRRTQGK